jgi:hypothetical protein
MLDDRPCDVCGSPRVSDWKYCGPCGRSLLREMQREGYLQPLPLFSHTPPYQRNLELSDWLDGELQRLGWTDKAFEEAAKQRAAARRPYRT